MDLGVAKRCQDFQIDPNLLAPKDIGDMEVVPKNRRFKQGCIWLYLMQLFLDVSSTFTRKPAQTARNSLGAWYWTINCFVIRALGMFTNQLLPHYVSIFLKGRLLTRLKKTKIPPNPRAPMLSIEAIKKLPQSGED